MFKQESDAEIWKEIKQDHQGALSELFYRYSDLLLSYCLTITQDRDLIKDCIQELFLDIWKRRDKLAEVEKVKYYLLSVIRRILLRRLKADERKLQIELPHLETSSRSEESKTIEKESLQNQQLYMAEKINLLPERQKEVIYLRYYLGMSHDEICEIMDIRKQAAWNLLSRAIKKLRDIIEDPRTSIILLNILAIPQS